MTAGRELDHEEATQILEQTQQLGVVPLPQLTDVDLCIFPDTYSSLIDEHVWKRWSSLTDSEQISLADTALGFLESRRLVRRAAANPGDQFTVNIQPKLGYILGIRQRPSFVGICSVPGWLRADDLRLFGLRYEENPDPIVLMERGSLSAAGELGQVRDYSLAVPRAASSVVVDWIDNSIDRHFTEDQLPRYFDFYTSEHKTSVERFVVSRFGADYQLRRISHGKADDAEATSMDRADLVASISARLMEEPKQP